MSDILQDEGIPVKTPSGGTFYVLTPEEEKLYKDRAQRYLNDYRYEDVSDLQDVDRVLMMETLIWRWGLWLSKEKDYWGDEIDLNSTKRHVNEWSRELRGLKKQLGMDKSSRERAKGENVADYLDNLRRRAKEFGYNRNEMAVKAITLFQELKAQVTLYNNCNEQERKEQGIELTDLLDWIEKIAIPEFDSIDEEFRRNQSYWVRTL